MVTITLATTPSTPIYGALFQGSPSGTGWIAIGQSIGNLVQFQVNPATLNPSYQYEVALSASNAQPVWGPSTILVFQEPTITAIQSSLSMVEVTWSLPATSTIASVYALLFDGNTVVVSGTSNTPGIQLVPPTPLNPSATYTVMLTGQNGVSSGPTVTSANLILASPTIASEAYTATGVGNACTLAVTPTTVGSPPGTVTGQLFQDNYLFAQQAASAGVVSFALTEPLDPRFSWRTNLFYTSGVIIGPTGPSFPVSVPNPPAISSLAYAVGTITVTLESPAVPIATVALFQGTPTGTGWVVSSTTSTSNAVLQLGGNTLNPGSTYYVAVSLDTTATPVVWSSATVLLFQTPTISSVNLTPQAVDMSWTYPATTNLSMVQATLYDQTASVGIVTKTFVGTAGRFDLPVPLNSAHVYVVTMSGILGNSVGQAVTSNSLILTSPTIASVVYAPVPNTQNFTIKVTASSPTGTIVARLFADGQFISDTPGSGSLATIALAAGLDPSAKWQVGLYYQATTINGPVGTLAEIPMATPVLAGAGFDGTNFTIALDSTPGSSGASVSIIRTDTGAEIGSATILSGSSKTFAPTTAVDPTKSYQAFLSPLLGLAQGLAGAGTSLIVAAPVITSVGSDGQNILVGLTSSGGSGNNLFLQSSGAVVMSSNAGLTGGYLPVPSIGLTSPAVEAQTVQGNVYGPITSSQSVILGVPTISGLAFGATAVTGIVTAPAGVSLTGQSLEVSLYADGVQVGSSVAAGTGGAFSLPYSAPIGASLTVRALVKGSSGAVSIVAPLCQAAPVLTNSAIFSSAYLTQTSTTDWQLVAEWSMPDVSQVSSYTVSLSQSGTVLKSWPITGTSIAVAAPTFDNTKTLELTVTALGNYGTAPISDVATFIPPIPAVTQAMSDGSSVSAQWTAPSAGAPTGYGVRLVASDGTNWNTIAESEVVSGLTASFAVPVAGLNTSKPFGVLIDVYDGIACTSTFTPTPLPIQPPTLNKVTATSSTAISLEWQAPSIPTTGITGYIPVVVWNGTETALPAVTTSPAAITLPGSVPNSAAISLRAVAGVGQGPGANALPIILEQSTGVFVSYDGANLSATWPASADPRVNAYSVTYNLSSGSPVTSTVYTNSFKVALAQPAIGVTATISVAPISGTGVGQTSALVSAVLQPSTIATSSYDGENLSLTWSAVAGASGYQVSILSGGSVTQVVNVGGNSAVIPVPNGIFAVQVQATGLSALGPASASYTPILASSSVSSTTFSPSTGDLTVAWSSTGAASYNVQIVGGGTTTSRKVQVASLTIAKASLPANGVYTIQVQSSASQSNDNNIGPWSQPATLVMVPPLNVQVEYDGRQAKVAWSSVPLDVVTGYTVTVLGASGATNPWTTDCNATIALPYVANSTFSVVVQASTESGNGLPSAASAVFQPGWYASADNTKAPYVFPANSQSMAAYDIVTYLPEIFATSVSSGLPTTPPFVFATTTAPFAYTLTMPHDSAVWTFDANSIRSTIQTAYTTLLQSLTTLGITPGGWRQVQDAIARSMPQTFAETLLYGYGLIPSQGYVDLKPGMMLRAEYQSYQYLGPGASNMALLDGYVTSATAEYEIGSYTDTHSTSWLIGLDAFLSGVTASGSIIPAPDVTTNVGTSGGGGIIDTYYSQFRQPFLRLVFPPQFLPSSGSSPKAAYNVALLAASDYQTLNTATANLRGGNPLGSGVAAMYLRGRSVLTAGLKVWVNDTPTTVPVGTTVGSLLQSMGRRPPVMSSLPIAGIKVTRSVGSAISSTGVLQNGYSVSSGIPMFLDWTTGFMYDPLTDWLALPLQPGDRIDTRGSE